MWRSALLALTASVGANAAAIEIRDGCPLQLSVNGNQGSLGSVGQYANGQAVVSSGGTPSTLTLKDGKLVDASGRGCWWTPPSTVLQCDPGQAPAGQWAVDCNGGVWFNGNNHFVYCAAGNGNGNLYTAYDGVTTGGINCQPVTLSSSQCKSCPPPPPPKPGPPSGQGSSPGATSCPADLNGDYQFPHLIIPVDKSHPAQAAQTSYFGLISPNVRSIFNFDIPSSYAGRKCSALFLFPRKDQLQTSDFNLTGSGALHIAPLYNISYNGVTSDNNAPAVAPPNVVFTAQPGNSYSIWTFQCPAGRTIAFEIGPAPGSNTYLRWFEDYNPSPIGLYIRAC
ncbi:hypothetical protein GQ53DRAFT_734629 [Thozetella sp. PMI_491]|nr:hypothetical protein GQ53DRAFT_734629 [Thozetella sp. PMI_491]